MGTNKFKRSMCAFIAAVMLAQCWEGSVVLAKTTQEATAKEPKAVTPQKTIEQMKAKFPHGAYWNHIVTYDNHQDAYSNYYEPCNNEDGYTWQPCATHEGKARKGQADCNSIKPSAIQCCGFALKVAKDVYGADPRYNWGQTTDRSIIKPGDVLHYYGAKAHATYGHWVIVTGVSGDSVTLGEASYGGNCRINWGRKMNRYSPSSMKIYRAPSDWTGAKLSKPTAPVNVKLATSDIGIGDAASVSWGASNGAESYNVQLQCTTNSAYNQSKEVKGTSTSFQVNNEGTYKIIVSAKNSAGTSATAASGECVVHSNVTATYVDYDKTVINTQSVKWGGNTVNPVAPVREGYTFQGWSNDGKALKSNTTITAQYQINSYVVKFVDYNGNVIGNSQKIEYGKAAVAPTDIPAAAGYIFSSWNTEDYKCVKSNLTVQAVYVWENINLPIVTEITSAKRNEEATGYNVSVKMTNFPSDFTKGKIVVTLKTQKGKMVASETEAVSLPASGTYEKDILVLYSGIASQVEVSLVGVIDDETTGTPKSKMQSGLIDVGNEWSDWSGNPVPEGDFITESRTEYRYKDKKVIKSVNKPTTPVGYTYESSAKTGTYTEWGAWSGWSSTVSSSSTFVNAESATFYRYYAFVCPKCGTRDPYSGTCSKCGSGGLYWQENWGITSGYNYGYTAINSSKGRIYWQNMYWYFELNGAADGQGGYGQPRKTLWRYRTRQEYSNYVYWPIEFCEWQSEAVGATNERKVETRTAYRFKSNSTEVTCYNYKRYKYRNLNNGNYIYTYSSAYPDSMEYPGEWEYNVSYTELKKITVVDGNIDLYNGYGEDSWYRADVNSESNITNYEDKDTLEDKTGVERTIKGTVKGAAGKCATLLVYKGKNVDPTASQLEYVEQTVIDENGNYQFTFVTKEEPTATTGDFVITLGVEGATDYMNIGLIEAPKSSYTVEFLDVEGNVLDTQTVVEGGNAIAPKVSDVEGYEFIGWDTGLNNVRENLVINAKYKKKMCTVIFVDWDNSSLAIKEFEYGDTLEADNIPEKVGEKFADWIDQNGNVVTNVTKNMLVTASYKEAKYIVTFLDWDGNIVSEQELAFGESAQIPKITDPSEENLTFAKWSSNGAEEFVTSDLMISPISKYKENAKAPKFSVTDGTYTKPQHVFLSCATPGAKIYYYLKTGDELQEDFVNEKVEGTLYSDAIEVAENTAIYAYAIAEGVNASEFAKVEILIGAEENEKLEIIQQPQDFSGEIGETAIFTVTATGTDLSYQWQYQNVGSTTWSNSTMAGSKTASILVPITKERIGQKYRCVIVDGESNIVVTNESKLVLKNSNPFIDIKETDYYYDPVLWAVEQGITSGKDATHFLPDGVCTRAQVVTFLWRANGQPEPTIKNPFVDVKSSEFYYKAVLWALESGITQGKDATHFQPDVTVNRSQVVTFMWRAEGQPKPTVGNPFVDVPKGSFYEKAVLWAYENEITLGKDATHFQPEKECIRAQVVTFLYRNEH